MKLVSVIIPVYNTERYLKKCLDSVLEQDYPQLEVVTIDDCSMDTSKNILVNYEKRWACRGGQQAGNKRVINVFLSRNQGVDNARIEGLKRITGDYVIFVDSDDYLPEGAISKLVDELERTGADIVQGSYRRVLGNNGFIKKDFVYSYVEIEQPELFDKYFVSFFGKPLLRVGLWGKIYRRELFQKSHIEPSGYRFGEDAIMNMKIFPCVGKYAIVPSIIYCYRYGGMTNKYKPYLYDELKHQYQYRLQVLRDYNYETGISPLHYEMANNFIGILKIMLKAGVNCKDVHAFYKQELESGELRQFVVERHECKNILYNRLYNSVINGMVDETFVEEIKKNYQPALRDRLVKILYIIFGRFL